MVAQARVGKLHRKQRMRVLIYAAVLICGSLMAEAPVGPYSDPDTVEYRQYEHRMEIERERVRIWNRQVDRNWAAYDRARMMRQRYCRPRPPVIIYYPRVYFAPVIVCPY